MATTISITRTHNTRANHTQAAPPADKARAHHRSKHAMPKLKPETQRARIEHILDAAEQCFARSGFHACTMAEICTQAHVSPGALYGHFASKEDLIAGIVERNRTNFAQELSQLAQAGGLMSALNSLGEHYAVDEPRHKRVLCLEIGAESTRNAKVGKTFKGVDEFIQTSFAKLFEREQANGTIKPAHDPQTLAQLIMIIGDGLLWRRAIDPNFDAKAAMPAIMSLVKNILNPVDDKIPETQNDNLVALNPRGKS